MTVLTAVLALDHYRTWFEPRSGVPLHVSAGAMALGAWVEKRQTTADWAMGFPLVDERGAIGEPGEGP